MGILKNIQNWINSFIKKDKEDIPKRKQLKGKSHDDLEVHHLKSELLDELEKEKERLQNVDTKKKIFLPEKIDSNLLSKLFKELNKYENFYNDETKTNKRKESLEIRNQEIIEIQKLKNEVLSHSLIYIHQKREQVRIEQERLEREILLNKKYQELIEQANKYAQSNNYGSAYGALNEAIEIKPENKNKIQKLKTRIRKEENDFLNRKKQYDILKAKVQELISSREKESYSNAIKLLEDAKRLNIDNYFCNNKIEYCKSEVRRIEAREAERKKREQEEIERKKKYKDDAEEIIQVLKQNGINQFYHFTDNSNISTILQFRGLYSWTYCENNNIPVSRYGGDNLSRNLDRRYGLENYVRLSYNKGNPMAYIATKEGRITSLKWLEIDINVATFRKTLFSNMNATKTGFKKGGDANFLKKEVRFDVVKWAKQWDPITGEKSHYYQAEVMVWEKVPLECIINLNE